MTTAKERLALAKHSEELRAIERRANIAALNDYIDLIISKGMGLAALIAGGLEYIDPGVLHITLKNPGLIAGLGLAMLTGKNLISVIARFERLTK